MGKVNWLLSEIWDLHQVMRNDIMRDYDRSLPFADELTDRWERAKFLGFGEGSSVYDSVLVIGNVKVGKKTWVGPGCILDGSGGLEVGDYCSISSSSHIYSHSTVDWSLSGGKSPYKMAFTKVGNCCFLGSHSVIMEGVTIGNHCLIGANSLVNKDVYDFSFVAGNPAKVCGKVTVKSDGQVEINES